VAVKIWASANDLTTVNVTSHWDSSNREAFRGSFSDRIPEDAVFIGTDKVDAVVRAEAEGHCHVGCGPVKRL
jgi:hypothetical protein